MERINLVFLHGFLGRPSDWALVKAYLPQTENLRIYTPDYFKDENLGPVHSFEQWAENFNKWTERQIGHSHKNILVGYSLGGRLALHAIENQPSLWHKAVLLSTNPGFDDNSDPALGFSEERAQRWLSDSYWAEEFLMGSWENVIKNWNAQPVFSNSANEPHRIETDYIREDLGLILTHWSLAQQKNKRSVLKQWADKILWLVGEHDEKFIRSGEQLSATIPELKVDVVQGASHRILFDNPKALAERLRRLLQQFL